MKYSDIMILKPEHKGRYVKCRINNRTELTEGRIQVVGERIFICQNDAQGNECGDTLGYKYSWDVASGGDLHNWDVTDVELMKLEVVNEYEIY